jgi:hypothetical protein
MPADHAVPTPRIRLAQPAPHQDAMDLTQGDQLEPIDAAERARNHHLQIASIRDPYQLRLWEMSQPWRDLWRWQEAGCTTGDQVALVLVRLQPLDLPQRCLSGGAAHQDDAGQVSPEAASEAAWVRRGSGAARGASVCRRLRYCEQPLTFDGVPTRRRRTRGQFRDAIPR